MTDVVLYEVADRVATVTLNRPEARNALSRQLQREIRESVSRAGDDDEVDVVILTGADPAFCAGVDLKELGSGGNDMRAAVSGDRSQPGPLPRIAKPIIGAINGVAITGGFELALNCDFLVASDRARFADTHSRVGIMPGWGLTVLLAEAVGVRRARELSATGNFLDAETALAWGLVNHVVPHDELLATCRQLAADIVSNDQAGVRRILQTYDEGWLMTGADFWDNETKVSNDWLRDRAGFAEEVEARRKAVMERGRSQTS
ncbi:MAG: enoyl-CoA hydratase [Acidimicrobiia bacterium]|nr:enoyl-CoA hydratase [Acidimicrobiia bacterium]